MQKKWLFPVLLGVALLLAGPFLLSLAGDAQVHLAVAEKFATARPFQYNPTGEQVVASTSPFWSLWLMLSYQIIGYDTPILLQLVVLGLWVLTGYLLYDVAQRLWHFSGWVLWGTVLLWFGHTTVIANALGGLENVLSAFQLLWLYRLTAVSSAQFNYRRACGVGLLLGWMVLTRPDGGLLGATLLTVVALSQLRHMGGSFWQQQLPKFLLIGLCAFGVLLPWYLYQYRLTGQLVTDSSVARLLTGRQGAIPLILGRFYLHPKAILSLASAFLPLILGTGVVVWQIGRRHMTTRSYGIGITAVVLLSAATLFYTFVVGAEAFGRYFLPLYPFLFLTGVAGWQQVAVWWRPRYPRWVTLALLAVVIFLVGVSGFDYYRRVSKPAPTAQLLDVIYGPAHRQYFSYNLPTILAAPSRRYEQTAHLLQQVNREMALPVKFAVTEVQLRYFVDDRVEIVSLDGRTSATILGYFEPVTGVPDFERYFMDVQPDLVHVNQWCEVGGWLTPLLPFTIQDNLVCQWQQQTEMMKIGDGFEWQGRRVTLVAPEIVHIEWKTE